VSLVVGFDIGLQGAIGFYDSDLRILLKVVDMPVDRFTVGGKVRGRVSDVRLLLELAGTRGGHAFLERPEARPMRGRDKNTGGTVLRTPGAACMLAFGEGYGMVHCACVASGLALTEVRPGVWKRDMGVSGDKDEARRRAMEMFPTFASEFVRVKDDGRGEACLIAVWGSRQLGRRTA